MGQLLVSFRLFVASVAWWHHRLHTQFVQAKVGFQSLEFKNKNNEYQISILGSSMYQHFPFHSEFSPFCSKQISQCDICKRVCFGKNLAPKDKHWRFKNEYFTNQDWALILNHHYVTFWIAEPGYSEMLDWVKLHWESFCYDLKIKIQVCFSPWECPNLNSRILVELIVYKSLGNATSEQVLRKCETVIIPTWIAVGWR
jgi:hypothetical protein